MGEVIKYLNAKHVVAPGNWDLVAYLASSPVNQSVCVKSEYFSPLDTIQHPRMQPFAAWACCEESVQQAVVFTQLVN